MAQSCGMMFIDLPDGSCYGDQNPVSEQKITPSNQIMNNRKKTERTKQKQK
jgi:hypothetical protein